MASGYFPLLKYESLGRKLSDAADLIEHVCDALQDDVYSGVDGQYDNAASDDRSLALLHLAAELCRDEIRD